MTTSTIRAVEGGVLVTVQEYFNRRFNQSSHLFATPAEAKAFAASLA